MNQELETQKNQSIAAEINPGKYEMARLAPERNLKLIWLSIEDELKFAPEYAEEAWYSIPYKDKKGNIVPVEGIGIRGATMMARLWGYCLSGNCILQDLGDKVIARGIFIDYKTGFESVKEVIVNRYQVAQDGKTYRLIGKHWDNAIQSALSKAQRNATLEGIPAAMKEKMFALAKSLALNKGVQSSPEQIKADLKKAKENFIKKFKLTEQIYDDYIAGLAAETDSDLLSHLKGLWSGLKSGETNLREVFGIEQDGKMVVSMPEKKDE